MFFDDAVVASRLLGLTLTKRQDHPMAGIPTTRSTTTSASSSPPAKRSPSATRQSPPRPASSCAASSRASSRPAPPSPPTSSTPQRNHYLCASRSTKGLHAAWLDLSTGEFKRRDRRPHRKPAARPHRARPAELLVEGELARWQARAARADAVHALHAVRTARLCTELPGYHFDTATGAKTVMDALGVLNLQGFGLAHDHPALGPAGALVYYATENLCAKPENLRGLQEYRSARTLLLDPPRCATSRSSLHPRHARRLAARRDQPHGHRRRRPPARALARRAHARPRRNPPPPGHSWRTARPAAAPGRAARALARSATSRASSAACKTACAIRANSAA
jgi:DNA mismatch repair protein MutS